MYVNAKVYFNEYIVEVAMEYTYLGINFLFMCFEFLMERKRDCKQGIRLKWPWYNRVDKYYELQVGNDGFWNFGNTNSFGWM